MTNKVIIQGLNDINYMLSYTEMYLPEQYAEHKKVLDAAVNSLDKINYIYDSWNNFTLDFDSPRAMRCIGEILNDTL